MKLLDLPFVYEVREEYIALRDELQRKKAVNALMKEYPDELEDADDSAYFWLGIALGQDELGELTEEYRQNALSALTLLGEDAPTFEEGELDFLNNVGAKKKKSKNEYINWKSGDVFLYDLSGPYAEEAHIDDCSLLLYVIGYHPISRGSNLPLVYLLLNLSKDAPTSKEELEECGFLDLSRNHIQKRMGTCQTIFTYKNKMDFEDFSLKLKYVGNFPDVSLLPSEAISHHELSFVAPISIDAKVSYAFTNGYSYYLSEYQ